MLGLLAAVSRIAAILPNDFAPTNMNGPEPTLVVIAAKVRFEAASRLNPYHNVRQWVIPCGASQHLFWPHSGRLCSNW